MAAINANTVRQHHGNPLRAFLARIPGLRYLLGIQPVSAQSGRVHGRSAQGLRAAPQRATRPATPDPVAVQRLDALLRDAGIEHMGRALASLSIYDLVATKTHMRDMIEAHASVPAPRYAQARSQLYAAFGDILNRANLGPSLGADLIDHGAEVNPTILSVAHRLRAAGVPEAKRNGIIASMIAVAQEFRVGQAARHGQDLRATSFMVQCHKQTVKTLDHLPIFGMNPGSDYLDSHIHEFKDFFQAGLREGLRRDQAARRALDQSVKQVIAGRAAPMPRAIRPRRGEGANAYIKRINQWQLAHKTERLGWENEERAALEMGWIEGLLQTYRDVVQPHHTGKILYEEILEHDRKRWY